MLFLHFHVFLGHRHHECAFRRTQKFARFPEICLKAQNQGFFTMYQFQPLKHEEVQ